MPRGCVIHRPAGSSLPIRWRMVSRAHPARRATSCKLLNATYLPSCVLACNASRSFSISSCVNTRMPSAAARQFAEELLFEAPQRARSDAKPLRDRGDSEEPFGAKSSGLGGARLGVMPVECHRRGWRRRRGRSVVVVDLDVPEGEGDRTAAARARQTEQLQSLIGNVHHVRETARSPPTRMPRVFGAPRESPGGPSRTHHQGGRSLPGRSPCGKGSITVATRTWKTKSGPVPGNGTWQETTSDRPNDTSVRGRKQLAEAIGVTNVKVVSKAIDVLRIAPVDEGSHKVSTYNNGGTGYRRHEVPYFPPAAAEQIRDELMKRAIDRGGGRFEYEGVSFQWKAQVRG